jgi:type I restriction enzyme S subunit
MTGYFRYLCVKHVNQASVSSEVLAIKVPAVLPPSREQTRILEEIDKQFTRLEAGVAALRRVQTNLKCYRAAVLKAAVEGRLVPTEAELACRESHSYEPASELLTRIIAERRARWEADQLAKFLACGKEPKNDKWKAKYKEPAPPDVSNLPALPEGWVWASLEQLSWDASYGTSEKCDYSFSGPPVLRIPNVESGRINLEDLKHASTNNAQAESDALCPGDFLIIRTNGSRDLIGRGAVINSLFERPHFYASYLIRFRLVASTGIAPWLGSTWDCSSNRIRIEAVAATTAGQYNLNISKLSRLPVPLPPLEEQGHAIADIDRRFSVIHELEIQVEANLRRGERLRQAILKRAFEGKLVPQDPDDEPANVLVERIRAERNEPPGRASPRS